VSNGPIPPIGPDDLKFVPEGSDFAGLVGNELGTLGTNQDGFDALFNDAAALASTAGAVLDSSDADLEAASAFLPEFDPTVPTNLMASLQPASDAADTALAQFNVDVPPDPTGGTPTGPGTAGCAPGTVIGGLTIGKPDPNSYPTAQGVPNLDYHVKLNTMCVNDPPQDTVINTSTITNNGRHWSESKIWAGDTTIFSTYASKRNDNGDSYLRDGHLVVTPRKAGRFSFVIEFWGTDNGWNGVQQFDVTIVDPPRTITKGGSPSYGHPQRS
jgi:hypothetical protein